MTAIDRVSTAGEKKIIMRRVLLIGDSNMASATDNNYEAAAYVQSNTDDIILVNAAVSGMQARLWRDNYTELLTNYPWDFVVIDLGINDWLYSGGYNDTAGDYYQHLIDLMQIRPHRYILMGPPPASNQEHDFGGGILATYRCMSSIAAAVRGMPWIDTSKIVSFPEDYPTDPVDGIHYTDQGRGKILDELIKQF